MKVLLIYAHPEPRSLNGALKNFAVRHLQQAGHEVQVSDLYAMRWKAGYDADDSGAPPVGEFWRPTLDSKQAFAQWHPKCGYRSRAGKAAVGRYGDFPVPAMVVLDARHHEGLDRQGVRLGLCLWRRRAQRPPLGDRYGEGTFVGKRAMLIVTAGGWAEHYSPRGINGPIDDILFPIQHGMLFYPGFEVLPPLVFYRTDKTDAGQFADQCAALAERLDTLWQTEPIPFRRQNHGDYLIPSLTLRPELAPGQSGLAVHLRSE